MEHDQLFLVLCTVMIAVTGVLLLMAFSFSGVPGRRVTRAGVKMTGVVVFLLTGLLHAHQFVVFLFPLATGVFFLSMAPLLDSVAILHPGRNRPRRVVWYVQGNIQGILLLVLMLGEYALLSWLDVIHFRQ